jgi:hypothetical protein
MFGVVEDARTDNCQYNRETLCLLHFGIYHFRIATLRLAKEDMNALLIALLVALSSAQILAPSSSCSSTMRSDNAKAYWFNGFNPTAGTFTQFLAPLNCTTCIYQLNGASYTWADLWSFQDVFNALFDHSSVTLIGPTSPIPSQGSWNSWNGRLTVYRKQNVSQTFSSSISGLQRFNNQCKIVESYEWFDDGVGSGFETFYVWACETLGIYC